MYVCGLHVILTFNPALYIDVRHFLSSEEGIIFKYHVVSVPYDTT